MTEFAFFCLRCGTQFGAPLPRVFCSGCRPIAAEQAEEAVAKFYLDHPDFPVPGDSVRKLTDEDAAFEAAVMADLERL